MMSHLKDCLVESPSLSGSADGENEVEGVKVKKIAKGTTDPGVDCTLTSNLV